MKFDVGLTGGWLEKHFEGVAQLPEAFVVPLCAGEHIHVEQVREDIERILAPTCADAARREVPFGRLAPGLAEWNRGGFAKRRADARQIVELERGEGPAVQGPMMPYDPNVREYLTRNARDCERGTSRLTKSVRSDVSTPSL